MANRLIFYTSESEGLTIGVSGDSWMECLTVLADEFGEGVLPMYEAAKDELESTAAAVAEAFPDEMEAVSQDLARAIMRQQASTDVAYEDTIKDAEDAQTDRPPTVEPIDSGARQESLPEADDVRPAGSDPDLPVCEVCGATTTKDYATVTRMDYGEVRCKDCTP